MHITLQRHGDPALVRRMIWAAARRNLRRLWTLAGIFVLLGIIFLIVGAGVDDGGLTVPGVVLVVAGVVYAFLPLLGVRRQTRRLMPMFSEPATITVTDADVTVENSTSTHIFRWPGLVSVRDVAGFWFLNNRANMPSVIIPQDGLTPADSAELRAFFAGRSLMPSTYRVG